MNQFRLIIPMTLVSAVLLSCGPGEKSASDAMTETAETTSEPTLELLWETPEVFITNESVHYEPSNGQLYVANIEGEPAGKDGVGSISILSKAGEIIEQEWVTGLNAPKGMTVMDGKLYVTDVDALVDPDNPVDGPDIAQLVINRTEVTLTMALSGGHTYTGTAKVASYSETPDMEQPVAFSVSFTGNGPIELALT